MKRALALVACLVLAGCGNDGSNTGIGTALLGSALKVVSGARGATAVRAPVTRAEIDKYEMPLLRVTIPARAYDALLTVRDDKGDVVTWTTTDGVTFTFRQGVLIETRGLGADLMSSAAPGPAQLARTGQGYERSFYVVGDNDVNERRTYACTTELVGREVIEVVGRTFTTQHLRETCLRGDRRVVADYWLEGSFVRKSKQWIGPDAGFAEFARVNG